MFGVCYGDRSRGEVASPTPNDYPFHPRFLRLGQSATSDVPGGGGGGDLLFPLLLFLFVFGLLCFGSEVGLSLSTCFWLAGRCLYGCSDDDLMDRSFTKCLQSLSVAIPSFHKRMIVGCLQDGCPL